MALNRLQKGGLSTVETETETRRDPVGLLGTKVFPCPPGFLFMGNGLHSASLTFPEFQRPGSKSCFIREGGDAETRAEQWRNNSAALEQGVFLLKEYTEQDLWVLLQELRPPTQVEDGHFRLSTRFLEHRPVTSPPTNQGKVCTQWKISNTLTPSPNDSPSKNSDGQRNLYSCSLDTSPPSPQVAGLLTTAALLFQPTPVSRGLVFE